MPTLYLWLVTYLLLRLPIVVRIFGVMVAAPVFSAQQVPKLARVLLGVGIGVLMAPAIPIRPGGVWVGVTGYTIGLVSELLWGIALGLGVSLLLEAARLAGEMLDLQMGFRVASLFDPISGSQLGIFSHIYYLVALLMFLQLNGHHWLLMGLGRSFLICPAGSLSCDPQLTEIFLDLVKTIFHFGIRLAAPVLLAVFLADLAFGLVSRMVPQMNVFIVGIPAKIAVGLLAMIASTPLLAGLFSSLLSDFKAYIEAVLRTLA